MALYKGEDKIKDIYLGDVPIFKVYAGEEFCGFFTFSHENLVENSDFTSTSNWTAWQGTGSVANGVYTLVGDTTHDVCAIYQDPPTTIGNLYYISGEFMTPDSDIAKIRLAFDNEYSYEQISPVANTWYKKSYLRTAVGTLGRFLFMLYHATSISGKTINARNPILINITDLVSRGILPSGLTDSQYKDILDNYFNS